MSVRECGGVVTPRSEEQKPPAESLFPLRAAAMGPGVPVPGAVGSLGWASQLHPCPAFSENPLPCSPWPMGLWGAGLVRGPSRVLSGQPLTLYCFCLKEGAPAGAVSKVSAPRRCPGVCRVHHRLVSLPHVCTTCCGDMRALCVLPCVTV